MKTHELLPCPFCGSDEASLLLPTCTEDSKYNPADRAFPSVFCIGCFVSVPGRDWDRSGDSAIAAWNRRAEPEREVEPVADPAGYFCEPYLNKPGLFEQVFNGFDDPDVIPLYRDPNGRIAALEREVDRMKQQYFTDLCNSADVKRLISVVAYPDNYADQDFSEMAKRVLEKLEQNIKNLEGRAQEETK